MKLTEKLNYIFLSKTLFQFLCHDGWKTVHCIWFSFSCLYMDSNHTYL